MRVSIGLLAISAVLLSCSDLANEGLPQVTIRTDGVSYAVGQSISVATNNELQEMVVIAPCCSDPNFRIQRRNGTTWTMVFPECDKLMCPSVLLPLSPQSKRIDTIRILTAGYYRLMLRYQNQRTLETDSAYSNEFIVQ